MADFESKLFPGWKKVLSWTLFLIVFKFNFNIKILQDSDFSSSITPLQEICISY